MSLRAPFHGFADGPPLTWGEENGAGSGLIASGTVEDGNALSRADPDSFMITRTIFAGDVIMVELVKTAESSSAATTGVNLTIPTPQ